jgi:hypothetical protein
LYELQKPPFTKLCEHRAGKILVIKTLMGFRYRTFLYPEF